MTVLVGLGVSRLIVAGGGRELLVLLDGERPFVRDRLALLWHVYHRTLGSVGLESTGRCHPRNAGV